MAWLEITVETASTGIDRVAEALTAKGFADLVLEDQQEFEDFLDDNKAYWDYIDEDLQQKLQGLSRIKLYLEDTDSQGLARLQQLLDSLKAQDTAQLLGSLSMTLQPLADTDWEESWKDNYPPQPMGERLVMLPYWLDQTDTEGRLPVILDPGLTFGTGAHPTTQMVVAAMEELMTPNASCLDLGSGSGILSLAALRLGAGTAVGVDIDPKAEDVARQNAAYNGFGPDRFTALTGNVITDKQLMSRLTARAYDFVFVNIVADVIIALSPVLPRLMDGNSRLICSGILDSRLEEVQAALRQAGLTVTQLRAEEEWRCLCAKR